MESDRILLVDDDPLVLSGVSRQLEAEGYKVSVAPSAKAAIDRLASQHFDLIVTDLIMEGPNGLDLLELAKRRVPDTGVIILTGYGDVHSAIDALRLGADDYLLKPSDPNELLFRIRGCIERLRLRRSNDELGQRVADRTAELERENAMHKAARAALSRSLREKEVLLREIQHRVKNNLATISGLINLQGTIRGGRPIEEVLNSLKQRVRAIHLIYEKVYRSRDLSLIDYRDYVESLARSIYQLVPGAKRSVEVRIDMESIQLDIDTSIPLGLITTELLSNALTHAFPGGRHGTVVVRLVQSAGSLLLTVTDDGIGLPDLAVLDSKGTLGFRLVRSLADQMSGRVEIDGAHGASISIRVPTGIVE